MARFCCLLEDKIKINHFLLLLFMVQEPWFSAQTIFIIYEVPGPASIKGRDIFWLTTWDKQFVPNYWSFELLYEKVSDFFHRFIFLGVNIWKHVDRRHFNISFSQISLKCHASWWYIFWMECTSNGKFGSDHCAIFLFDGIWWNPLYQMVPPESTRPIGFRWLVILIVTELIPQVLTESWQSFSSWRSASPTTIKIEPWDFIEAHCIIFKRRTTPSNERAPENSNAEYSPRLNP